MTLQVRGGAVPFAGDNVRHVGQGEADAGAGPAGREPGAGAVDGGPQAGHMTRGQ